MTQPKFPGESAEYRDARNDLLRKEVELRRQIESVAAARRKLPIGGRWARKRGWRHLRLLSSRNNSYNRDYLGETEDWGQVPSLNVFRKTDDGIYHSYNTEMLFARTEEDQEPRHVDLIWPLWNLFDLTPEGRGTDWHPRFDYD